jgi:hypothetical protein
MKLALCMATNLALPKILELWQLVVLVGTGAKML